METLLVLAVLAFAVVLIVGPLRSGRADENPASVDRAELEAAKEVKYREIREVELDYRIGKLSEQDWQALDSGLRADAIDLLHRLDALGPGDDERRGG
jgi:hypothetical protein